MSNRTEEQYDAEVHAAREIYRKKVHDYGTSWRILRPSSLTDQIFIKAQRIRTLQEEGQSKVGEGVEDEFRGILNYCVIGLIQIAMGHDSELELTEQQALDAYDEHIGRTKDLMMAKNHDYGEAWRDMRVESITDLILMKVLRMKQIEDNEGATLISEGIDANYMDIINYSIFALIKLTESHGS